MQSLSSGPGPRRSESQASGRVWLLLVQREGVLTSKEAVEEIICVLLGFGMIFNR